MNFLELHQSSAVRLPEIFEDKILKAAVKGDHRNVHALLFQCPKERRQELTNLVYSREQVGAHIPGSSDPQPLSALQIAVRFGQRTVARTLLDAGADPHLWLADKTCLHVAVINGDAKSVRLLLEAGARGDMPSAIFGEGCGGAFPNPLMLAAKYGYTDCLRLLLKAGTQDVDYRLCNGATALSLACQHGHVDGVQMLIQEGGASVDPDDGLHGESMLDMAVRVRAENKASRRVSDSGSYLVGTCTRLTSVLCLPLPHPDVDSGVSLASCLGVSAAAPSGDLEQEAQRAEAPAQQGAPADLDVV
jgi:ankyrin repeat protein